MRTGIGFDFHPFSKEDRPLRVAGVEFEADYSLAGHSDGDPGAHAVCDAVLSAAGLGDLGAVFGQSDPKLAGAKGTQLLSKVADLVASQGWQIVNASVSIIAVRPFFGDLRESAEQAMSSALGSPVSVTASSGNTWTATEQGIIAIATALVEQREG